MALQGQPELPEVQDRLVQPEPLVQQGRQEVMEPMAPTEPTEQQDLPALQEALDRLAQQVQLGQLELLVLVLTQPSFMTRVVHKLATVTILGRT